MSPPALVIALRTRPDCVGTGLVAGKLALGAGFSAVAAAEISLIVVELSSNAVRHGGGGSCTLVTTPEAFEVEVCDRGPGFPEAVLRDGGRSDRLGRTGPLPLGERQGRGMGSGLACGRRLAHELFLENRRNGGARVRAVCRRSKRNQTQPEER